MRWTCHVCRDERPDHLIGVVHTDLSAEHNLPPGTMWQNVRYCLDRPACAEGAKTHRTVAVGAVADLVQRPPSLLRRLLRR